MHLELNGRTDGRSCPYFVVTLHVILYSSHLELVFRLSAEIWITEAFNGTVYTENTQVYSGAQVRMYVPFKRKVIRCMYVYFTGLFTIPHIFLRFSAGIFKFPFHQMLINANSCLFKI